VCRTMNDAWTEAANTARQSTSVSANTRAPSTRAAVGGGTLFFLVRCELAVEEGPSALEFEGAANLDSADFRHHCVSSPTARIAARYPPVMDALAGRIGAWRRSLSILAKRHETQSTRPSASNRQSKRWMERCEGCPKALAASAKGRTGAGTRSSWASLERPHAGWKRWQRGLSPTNVNSVRSACSRRLPCLDVSRWAS
jgi:hypothetical protein